MNSPAINQPKMMLHSQTINRSLAKAHKAVELGRVEQAANAALVQDRIDNTYKLGEYTSMRIASLNSVTNSMAFTNPGAAPYLAQLEGMLAIGSAMLIAGYMGSR